MLRTAYSIFTSDSPEGVEEEEEDILDKAFDVRSGSRLGCQSVIEKDGEIEVEITRESLEAFENEHPEHRGKYTKRSA